MYLEKSVNPDYLQRIFYLWIEYIKQFKYIECVISCSFCLRLRNLEVFQCQYSLFPNFILWKKNSNNKITTETVNSFFQTSKNSEVQTFSEINIKIKVKVENGFNLTPNSVSRMKMACRCLFIDPCVIS